MSMNSHVRASIKNTLISLEIERFGVTNLNMYISLQRTLHRGKCNTLLNVILKTGIKVYYGPLLSLMDIDPAPFWTNLYLSKHKSDFMVSYLKLVSAIFIKFLFLHQMIALHKLKILFISSKKLFSFSRYSFSCISVLPSFSNCRPLL